MLYKTAQSVYNTAVQPPLGVRFLEAAVANGVSGCRNQRKLTSGQKTPENDKSFLECFCPGCRARH